MFNIYRPDKILVIAALTLLIFDWLVLLIQFMADVTIEKPFSRYECNKCNSRIPGCKPAQCYVIRCQ